MFTQSSRYRVFYTFLALSLSACGPNPTQQTKPISPSAQTSIEPSVAPSALPVISPTATTIPSSGEIAPSVSPTATGSNPLPTARPSNTATPLTATLALPTGLKIVEQTNSTVTLQWEFANTPAWYRLYLDGKQVKDQHTSPNYYRFEGLSPSTTYQLGVQVLNAKGATSDISNLKGLTLASGHSGSGNFSGGGSSGGGGSRSDVIYVSDGGEFQVNSETSGNQSLGDVGMDADGNYVVIWGGFSSNDSAGILGQRYDQTGNALGSEFQVNTYITGNQTNASVSMNTDGDFVVTWWSVGQDGDSAGIYAQRFDNNGSMLGSEFPVNTHTTNAQVFPFVALNDDGDFVVTWMSQAQDGDGYGIYGQRYNNTGSMQGSEFQISASTTGAQNIPQVAMDEEGDFVVIWSSGHTGDLDIYGQRFDSEASPTGSEFRINSHTSHDQEAAAIAMDDDGDFVVTWSSEYQDDNTYFGVYAQRFNRNGIAQSSEFRVNTYTSGTQDLPEIAMDANGDFVIIWESYGQDENYYGVYAQRYERDGSADGSEFQVNVYNTEDQGNPRIAMDAEGDFVTVWVSKEQDGDRKGIFGLRYHGIEKPSNFVNYSEFSSVLESRCSGCHGFTDSYPEIRAMNADIRDRVFVQQDMPDLGSDEADAITQSERDLIARWIDLGMQGP